MKIVVTGSLGNISRPLAEQLVRQGHAVTVISRNEDKRAEIEALGATAATGRLQDADFLTATFAGADALYAMIPPDFAAPDQLVHYQTIGRSYATALRRAGVRRVVHLSSWGAHLDRGTGFILGSHHVENLLNEVPDVALTHLRAGYIYFNLLQFIGMIKQAGFIGANYGGDDRLVLVAPRDIAAAAAEELTTPVAANSRVRYVASDERTCDDVARVLGAAIGQPDLPWRLFSDEQARQGMAQRGLPAHAIQNALELSASIHNGQLRADYDRHRPAELGQVKLEDFAREFAVAFYRNGQS